MMFTQNLTYLCKQRHDDGSISHPVDVFPSMEIPDDMQLDWDGRITCITCHKAHTTDEEGGLIAAEFLLRRDFRGRRFCNICHNNLLKELEKNSHLLSIDRVHMLGSDKKAIGFRSRIDTISENCISCHDGTVASETSVNMSSGFVWYHGRMASVNHPIGQEYSKVYTADMRNYKSPEMLDGRIFLPEGKVGCVSCHSPYSENHYELVMKNTRSALCLECHKK